MKVMTLGTKCMMISPFTPRRILTINIVTVVHRMIAEFELLDATDISYSGRHKWN